MSESKVVKGYKVFNPDWTCRGFQYKVGECYEMNEAPIACERGFHFCEKLADCFDYYDFDKRNKVAEITAYGEVVKEDEDETDNKCCTNKIKIEREMTWNEVIDMVNIGCCCEGVGNTGSHNNGDFNAGYRNVGNYNAGNFNEGDYNTGNYNTEDCNTGSSNIGSSNTGNYNAGNSNAGSSNIGSCNTGNFNAGNSNVGSSNIGNSNTGSCNTGNNNTGDYNTGNCNIGDCNIGSSNTGNYNAGNYNMGDCNIGEDNTGSSNTGDYNAGDYNIGNYNNGCFNTIETKIFLFNKLSEWTNEQWLKSDARIILMCRVRVYPTEWIQKFYMTKKEKEQHPEYETTGGYLKEFTREEIFQQQQQRWNKLSQEQKDIVMAIPNFDKEIFKEITGIDVDMEE